MSAAGPLVLSAPFKLRGSRIHLLGFDGLAARPGKAGFRPQPGTLLTSQFRWLSNAWPSLSISRLVQNNANKHPKKIIPRSVASRKYVSPRILGRCLKTTTANKEPPKIKLRRPKNKKVLRKMLGRRSGVGTYKTRYQNEISSRSKHRR